jgi:nitroreductase
MPRGSRSIAPVILSPSWVVSRNTWGPVAPGHLPRPGELTAAIDEVMLDVAWQGRRVPYCLRKSRGEGRPVSNNQEIDDAGPGEPGRNGGEAHRRGVELIDGLRSTGAIREFRAAPVRDEVLYRILDTARFAPSGGNRQGWRVVVLRDADTRRRLRDIYVKNWYEYLAISGAALTPWAPITDREAEAKAVATAPQLAEQAASQPTGFAEHLDEVPVLLVLLVDLRVLAAVDRDSNRYTFAGGASVYPFAWSLLLAARAEGLGGVMTTMPIRDEPEVKEILAAPEQFAVAAVIALGEPFRQPRRLTRSPVESFTTIDVAGGEPFSG